MALIAVVAVFVALAAFIARDGAPLGSTTRSWVTWGAVAVFLAGAVCRLYRFDRSLWIDEFGTLWTIEGGLGDAIGRAVAFHGQSPLYYLTIWPLVHTFGELEVVMRLPSLVCGAVATWFIYRTAASLASPESGWFAAALAWCAPVMMEASVNARAYAMATMFAAMACYGFARTVTDGRVRHRLLFVTGGAGLFLTQYISSLIMLGLGAAYVLWKPLRIRYPPGRFFADVVVQGALALLAVPQIVALWQRRGGLDWIGPPDYVVFFGLLAPFVVAWGTATARAERSTDQVTRAIERSFVLAIATEVGLLTAVAMAGTNLLAPRYLMVIVVPAAVLGGVALGRLRTPSALVAVLFAVILGGAATVMAWNVNGLLTTVPHQDWRTAVSTLDGELGRTTNAFVLYRPGFVEQDPSRPASPALLAPLRSPGQTAPAWPIVPLTFSWWTAGRATHFESAIVPRIASAGTFFLLNSGATPKTGDYARLLLSWIDARFPGEFAVRPLVPLVGVDLLRFDRVRPSEGGHR